jgi:hypothetical protein
MKTNRVNTCVGFSPLLVVNGSTWRRKRRPNAAAKMAEGNNCFRMSPIDFSFGSSIEGLSDNGVSL